MRSNSYPSYLTISIITNFISFYKDHQLIEECKRICMLKLQVEITKIYFFSISFLSWFYTGVEVELYNQTNTYSYFWTHITSNDHLWLVNYTFVPVTFEHIPYDFMSVCGNCIILIVYMNSWNILEDYKRAECNDSLFSMMLVISVNTPTCSLHWYPIISSSIEIDQFLDQWVCIVNYTRLTSINLWICETFHASC